jgi:hypothetical protein
LSAAFLPTEEQTAHAESKAYNEFPDQSTEAAWMKKTASVVARPKPEVR